MKQITCTLFIILILIVGKAQEAPFMVKNFDGDIREVEVLTSGGRIEVLHKAGETYRIEVYVNGNDNRTFSKEEIEAKLKNDYKLTIEVSNMKLYAKAEARRGFNDWKNSLSFSFRVFAPESVDTKLTSSGGSIYLTGVKGLLTFGTSGGSLHLEKVGGELNGTTSGGSISISNSNANGKLTTSGGSITAENFEGMIKLVTSGGSIKLNKLNGDIEAKTSGGSVTADDISGMLVTGTSGGNLRLTNLKCALTASTDAGSIEALFTTPGKNIRLINSTGKINITLPEGLGYDLDLRGDKISIPIENKFSGDITDESVKGKLNGGGIPVTIKAKGKITVTFNKKS